MKKLLTRFAWLAAFVPVAVLGQSTAAVTNYCVTGASQAITSGLKSSNYQQGIIRGCLITVYLSGTTTLATVYKDAFNTSLGNPFTANVNGSWLFYAAAGQGYDVVASGGIAPNVYPSPTTLLVDAFPGGGAGGGNVTAIIGTAPILANGTSGTGQIGAVTLSCPTCSGASHGVALPLSPNGVAATPSGLYQTAPYSYTIGACVFTTTTSDASTSLVINVKFNGTSILSGSSATISGRTLAGTVTSLTLGSSLTVTAGENFELDVASGTSNWTGAVSCHS